MWGFRGEGVVEMGKMTDDDPKVQENGHKFEEIDVNWTMFSEGFEVVVCVEEAKDGEGAALDVRDGEAPHVREFGRPATKAACGGVSANGDGGVARY